MSKHCHKCGTRMKYKGIKREISYGRYRRLKWWICPECGGIYNEEL